MPTWIAQQKPQLGISLNNQERHTGPEPTWSRWVPTAGELRALLRCFDQASVEEHTNNIKDDYSCGKEMASIHYTLAYKDMQALVQFEVNKINERTY